MFPDDEQKNMKLLGRGRLRALYGLDDETDAWIRSWVSELSHANWKTAKDVLRQFPRARNIANGVFQFPVGQHPQCIEVAMIFPQAVALVVDLKSTK
jgi:mRNA interferase HigB